MTPNVLDPDLMADPYTGFGKLREEAPVLLGDGIPFFDAVAGAPVVLPNPEVIAGARVTHLRYRLH